jgi:hypothetical protein
VPSGAARPVVSAVALRAPVLRHDDSLAPLESELLGAGLALSHAASAPAEDAPGEGDDPAALEAAVRAAQVTADRAAVRLFTKLVQSDRQARALEVAAALHTPAALAGAMKIANHQRAGTLAYHIAAMIERRMEADAAAEEAAPKRRRPRRRSAAGSRSRGKQPAPSPRRAAPRPPTLSPGRMWRAARRRQRRGRRTARPAGSARSTRPRPPRRQCPSARRRWATRLRARSRRLEGPSRAAGPSGALACKRLQLTCSLGATTTFAWVPVKHIL